MSFYIQGMVTTVNDLDIQSNQDGIYKIQEILKEHMVEPITLSSTRFIKSFFGEAILNDTKIELMGDIQRSVDGENWSNPIVIKNLRRSITFRDMTIPVLKLEYEYHAYKDLGRDDKADNIMKLILKVNSEKNVNIK